MKEENWEWVNISLLKTDGENPNVMAKADKEALRKNIEKYGWNMPIITDMDYMIADGEQKYYTAIDMKLAKVPILRKKLTDTDRRIIRQSMNKLRGTHNIDLDAAEFKKILEKVDMEDFTGLIGQSEQEILNALNHAEKDEGRNAAEQVEQLGHLSVTCPKCSFKFEKKDSA